MRLAFPSGRRSWTALLVVAALGVGVALGSLTHVRGLFRDPAVLASSAPSGPEAKPEAPASATSVTLPEAKIQAAGVRIEAARVVELPAEVIVPGTIEAGPNRRVDIRPRAPGVVRKVAVVPSQKVKAGDRLVLLDSAEVGTARLNLRDRQIELISARWEADWKATIAANVEQLVPELRKGTPTAVLEKQFASKELGNHRAMLLAAYSDLEIASHEEQKQASLFRSKIVGEHPAFVALHTREAAQAKFEAALEQVRRDAKQQRMQADLKLRIAEAAVIDAYKRLQILGVEDGADNPLAEIDKTSAEALMHEDVTAYPITAPFDGTIVNLMTVFSQHVEPNDVLFTLADLTRVWVVANIPESDFAVLPALKEGTVRVTAAAYPGRTFDAKVVYTGAMVDPATRTVRFVGETPNPDDALRLGMFVQIHLEGKATEPVLTVPSGAVTEIEGRPVVFLPGRDGRTFTARSVSTGRESEGRTVITSGLVPGERVVAQGAFLIKSELVLRNEPEEE